MPAEWKLICADTTTDATFADLDITDAVLSLQSLAIDQLTLKQEPDAGFIGTSLIPYNSIASITRDAVTFFSGRRRMLPRVASMPAEYLSYEIVGPWFDLERLTYGQRWKIWDAASEASTWQYKNRLILGQAEDGTAQTVGQVLAEVIAFAAANGANIVAGSTTAWPSIKLPWEEISNLKCSDVIIRLLAFVPDHKVQIDYSTATPTFNIVPRASATVVSLAIGTADIAEISITERTDMAPPGVRVKFERTHSVSGSSWESLETQEAGNPADPDAIDITLPLAGANLTTQTARIVTEALPVTGDPAVTDFLNKAWWKAQVDAFDKFADADITLLECTPTVEAPAEGGDAPAIEDLPRELLEGTVPAWLTGDVYTARVTLDLKYSYIDRREADGKKVAEVKEAHVSHSLVLTSVPTGTYTRTEGDYAEPAPDGFAAALYAAWSPLQYEGTIPVELEDCTAIARPGDVLNLTGGLAAWASMRAHIQQVQHEIATGRTTIVIGPARRVDPATLLSLMRRLRARAIPFNHLTRTSGQRQNLGDIAGGGMHQDKRTTAAPGVTTYQNVPSDYDPDAPYTTEIDLDPAAIAPPDAATRTEPVIIKPRIIQTVERQGDELVRVQRSYLVSEPVSDPVIIDPDEPGGGGEENPGDECDQNDHPGGDPPEYGDPVGGDHPGTGVGDPEPHPGTGDCYTTGDYT